jgi:AcrR family transcriptional regulator
MTESAVPAEPARIDESRPPRRGPGRPRKAAHDQAIVGAVRELLRHVGYGALTIDGVAARAGVGRPTVYRRWPSKAALVIGALSDLAPAQPCPDSGSLRDDLVAIRRRQLELLSSPEGRRVLPGLAADVAEDAELQRVFHRQYVDPWRQAVEQVVARAAERGEISDGADARLLSDVLTGPLFYRVLFPGSR